MPPTVSLGPGAGLCDGHWLREGEELCQVQELKEEDADVTHETSYSSIG